MVVRPHARPDSHRRFNRIRAPRLPENAIHALITRTLQNYRESWVETTIAIGFL
jgi:hypothetical protein